MVFIKDKLTQIKKLIKSVFDSLKDNKKALFLLNIIYTLGIIAIIRANFNYKDDIGRVMKGYKGWENFSRYTSNFLSGFIHGDNYLTDISPITQLIAVFLMSLASLIVIKLIVKKDKINFWHIIAVIPLALSPYFLECFSFKFDSIYMALSVLAAVFPLLFYQKHWVIIFFITILSMLLICTTYQAANGIYVMLVILLSMIRYNEKENKKDILKFIVVSVIGYILGLLIFKIFIMQSVDWYVSNSISFNKNFFLNIFSNYKKYFLIIKFDFKKEWLILIGLMCVLFIILSVRDSKQNKLLSFLMSSLALFLMIISMFGIYPILDLPLFAPRAMYGFGVFIALVAVYIVSRKKTYLSKTICLCLSWCFFVFSLTYGNALYIQKEYNDFRVYMVISDLYDLEQFSTKQKKYIQLSGSIGYSPVITNMINEFDVLKDLIPINFRENHTWGKSGFCNYYNIKNINCYPSKNLTEMNLPIIKETMYHTIRGDERNILIELY